MNESIFQIMSSVAQTVIALAALTASIAIPLLIYRAQKRRETLEFIHAVRTMWISIDSVVLQRDELIEIADSIVAPNSTDTTIRQRQQTWIALMILNAVYMDYLGAINGFHSEQALETIRQSLRTYRVSQAFYRLTQNAGAYDKGFRDLCRETKQLISGLGPGDAQPIIPPDAAR